MVLRYAQEDVKCRIPSRFARNANSHELGELTRITPIDGIQSLTN